mgnify:CR=1 FL=1
MNAVGIDVSKGKSMVAIMRPFGEIVSTPFTTIYLWLISLTASKELSILLLKLLECR